jgi:hypothetical protein
VEGCRHKCKAALVMQRWHAGVDVHSGPEYNQACAAPSDVRSLPTCSELHDDGLSGTLPKEWSTMTSLEFL